MEEKLGHLGLRLEARAVSVNPECPTQNGILVWYRFPVFTPEASLLCPITIGETRFCMPHWLLILDLWDITSESKMS